MSYLGSLKPVPVCSYPSPDSYRSLNPRIFFVHMYRAMDYSQFCDMTDFYNDEISAGKAMKAVGGIVYKYECTNYATLKPEPSPLMWGKDESNRTEGSS